MSQMLYKCPGSHAIHGGKFDYTIVDESEIKATIAAGWFLTTTEAKEAHDTAQAAEKMKAEKAETKAAKVAETAPPTREELLTKAEELGIKADGRWSDKRLSDEIAAALKA